LGTKCTKPGQANEMFERSFIWAVDRDISKEAFEKRISKENCPKVAKKS